MQQKTSKKTFFKKIFKITALKIALLIVIFFNISLIVHHKNIDNKKFNWISSLERGFYDARIKIRGQRKISNKVGILAIDNKSIAKFGRWPFNRGVYEKAFMNLKNKGVKWIAFDAIFSEKERPYLEDVVEDISNAIMESNTDKGLNLETLDSKMSPLLDISKGDLSLVKGIKNFTNIVQAFFLDSTNQNESNDDIIKKLNKIQPYAIDFFSRDNGQGIKKSDYPLLLKQTERNLIYNIDEILQTTNYIGFMNNEAYTDDGIVRAANLVRGVMPILNKKTNEYAKPLFFASIALKVAAEYLNREINVKFDDVSITKISLIDRNSKNPDIYLPLNFDDTGNIMINHYGNAETFKYISLADADENKLPQKTPDILIMGGTGTGINDIRPSPLDATISGVEHHAAIVENIIKNDFMSRPLEFAYAEFFILITTGILLSVILAKTSATKSGVLMILFVIFSFTIDRFLIFGKGYWLFLGTIYLQAFSIFMIIILFKYFTEEREKKKVKNAFQHYLNPAVISQLLEHPEKLKLGGEKKEMTVFFSDVRGFTTISEALSPEALTALLNEYFTPMTQIVLNSGGLLDKYIGDAIMAVWGAPLNLTDHADRAVSSALQMLDELDILRQKWKMEGLPLLDIGMGINTGFMTVGNMGSHQRFDYTVLGDSVNLASRLESINKEYHSRTIISQMTKDKLIYPHKFALRELDAIVVKGKTEPVIIYEVMRKIQGYENMTNEIIGLYAEALKYYKNQNWEIAEKKLREIQKINPSDGPTLTFLERCKYLKEHSPGDNWNGVWIMKSK